MDRDPHPTCTRCRGKICTEDLTCDICVGWSSAQWEAFAKKRSYPERKRSRHSGSLPPAPKTSPRAWTSSEVKHPEASSSSSLPSGGQAKRGRSQDAPGAASREASSPPARLRSSERGGSVSGCSSGVRERISASSAPSGPGAEGVARSQRTPPARSASSVASPRSSQRALRRGESGESSEVHSHSRSSHVSRSSDRGRIVGPALGRAALVTSPVDLALAPLPARGRERRRQVSSRSRSSDRYRSRHVRSRRDRSQSSDCYRSLARWVDRRDRSQSRDPPRRSRDPSPPSSDHSRSKDGGRQARREEQEGVETVAVSQAPVVSEASAAVAPPFAGGTVAALPSAVQDLARFFLSLAGSSSLGAVGGVAGVTVPASGVGA